MSKEKNNRRNFLKSVLTAGGAIATTSTLNTNSKVTNREKIKMLTADGKLVEVDKSVLKKNTELKRASDQEVFTWMTEEHKR